MKGQIFIVASILVAVALIMIATDASKIYWKEDYVLDYFTNVRAELINTVDNSYLNNENVDDSLKKYIEFTDKLLQEKGYTDQITYEIGTNTVKLSVYIEKNGEYYSDTFNVDRSVYT